MKSKSERVEQGNLSRIEVQRIEKVQLKGTRRIIQQETSASTYLSPAQPASSFLWDGFVDL